MKKFFVGMLLHFANAWAGTGIYITFNNLSDDDLEYINWETQNMNSHPGPTALPAKSRSTVYMELSNFWHSSGYNDWRIVDQRQNQYIETDMELAWINSANCANIRQLPYRSDVFELGRTPCSQIGAAFGIGYYSANNFLSVTLGSISMRDIGAFGSGFAEIEVSGISNLSDGNTQLPGVDHSINWQN